MIRIKSQKVSSDVLLRKVEEEVLKIDEVLNKKETVLKNADFGKEVAKCTYTIDDFIRYHDIDFVKFAYKALLNREPDKEGLRHYLEKLRSGEYTKTDVLVRLRYSKEGRSKNKSILGIKKRAVYTFLSSIPVIGYLIKTLKFLITVPKFMKHINALESYVFYQADYTNRKLESLRNRINQSVVSLEQRLLEVNNKLSKMNNEVAGLTNTLSEVTGILRKVDSELHTVKEELSAQSLRMDNLESRFSQLDLPQEVEVDVELKINRNKSYYSAFEDVFRGEKEEVKKRQEKYLKYIPKEYSTIYPVLDVGCGRGEFLELLLENNIEAIGVDINKEEIQALKERGFKAINVDVNTFLKETKQKFSSIVSFQVIEHFHLDYLKEFLQLSYENLIKDGVIILETINPWNYEAFARFYIDETHVKPIPPDTLSFMLRWIGFKDIKVIFTAPLKEKRYRDEDLKKLYSDYAIVGYKRDES